MFKKSLITLLTISVFGLGFVGCGEEETPPPPKVEKPKKIEKVETKKEASKFKQMSGEQKAVNKPKSTSLEKNDVVQPGKSGYYVLQIGISPAKAQAKKLRDKLRNEGYKHTYIVKVENPGELEGTFYRVRLGHFKTIPDARVFGHQVLKPMGISFWIDNKSNDKVGQPEIEEEPTQSSFSESAVESSDFQEEPQQEMAPPVETPVAQEPVVQEPAAAIAPVKEAVKEAAQAEVQKSTGKALKKASSELKEDDWAPANVAPSASDWDEDGWN